MKKTISIIALGIVATVFISAVLSSSEWGERDDDERYEKYHESEDHEYGSSRGGWLESGADVRAVGNETYQGECGGCHFAYQPGLLPGEDWERIMTSLDEHYGDDASLDETDGAISCAGGGFGIERLTHAILGLRDVHEVYPFPRMAEGKIAI